jgi:hypothetical protein
MALRTGGVLTEVEGQQSFMVEPLDRGALEPAPPEELARFTRALDLLRGETQAAAAAIEQLLMEIAAIRQSLPRSAGDESLRATTREIEIALLDLQLRLKGSETREIMGDVGPVAVTTRLTAAWSGTRYATYGPTPTHSSQYEIAQHEFAAIREELNRIVEVDMPEHRAALNAAGVPWTPGRSVPAGG